MKESRNHINSWWRSYKRKGTDSGNRPESDVLLHVSNNNC